jgi:hypothetical protein
MARKPRLAIAAMTRVRITRFMSRPFAGAGTRSRLRIRELISAIQRRFQRTSSFSAPIRTARGAAGVPQNDAGPLTSAPRRSAEELSVGRLDGRR